MANRIDVIGLEKSFGAVRAVDGISFHVKTGSLFSFLGTNGAGKSTTIAILLGLLKSDAGTVLINGKDPSLHGESVRREIGVVFQESLLDPLLTVRENLFVRARLYGMSRKDADEAIQRTAGITGIQPLLKRKYGKLSGGQKRRTDIARALLHEPSILVLDEPTTGLDPESRRQLWDTITLLQRESDLTVFLTTHYIEEADRSDYAIILNSGQIIASGTPDALRTEHSADRLLLSPANTAALRKALSDDEFLYREHHGRFEIELDSTLSAIPIVARYEPLLASFEVKKSSLEDVFLRVQERKEADANADTRKA
ncbi:ABC transporter [Sporosarcina sp. NCCP-2716]|uniref:ABC transporter ATP-binding protein n=1 Tax=Sporosarcina sp. NCCP-2716 TaxID=2943679 RepID=UPI00203D6876|nr:ABC transporter ATP-binding protein [Sporosarcina sp. NCCP-2716]GKV67524.1 ABC transporter [Sporosarcina sp. NCCP-2716]